MLGSSVITKRLSIFAALVMLAGCNGGHNQTNIELIQDMMESPAYKAQDFKNDNREQSSMLTPPEGTVPRGFEPYAYPQDPAAAENNLKNPVAGDFSPELLARGQKKFETYCAVCHGMQGLGDGPVSGKMAVKPPPLMSDKVKNFKDGRIFHIITVGQGVMGSYASQIVDKEDRWSIVNYIRSMQKKSVAATAQGATK